MNRDQKVRSILLLILFISPFFMAMSASTVWDSNEAFYVQTPREMVDSGDWLVPEFNGNPRLNKPPLSYWLVAVLYKLFGVNLFWERFLMALLAGISIFSTFFIGRILYSPEAAILGAGIFATTFRFLIVSRRLLIDSLVLCCILVAIALFLHWIRSRNQYACLLSALFFGLAFLAKGPVGLLPALFLGIYCLLPQNRWCLKAVPWKTAALVFLATASSWFIALGVFHGWDPVAGFFLSENIGRFAGEDFGPERGYTYYIGVFMGDFFPWSLPFLGIFVAGAASFAKRLKASKFPLLRAENFPASPLFLACWILTYFLIFSCSQNKQEYYILPAYPAAALLLASAFTDRSKALKIGMTASGLVLLALPPLIWFINGELFADQTTPWWLPAGAALIAGLCMIKRQLLLAILGMVLFYQTTFFALSLPLENYKPVAPLADEIRALARTPDYQVGYYLFTAPSLRFYSDRNIHEIYELDEALRLLRSPGEVYLITDRTGLEQLENNLGEKVRVAAEKRKISTRLRTLISRLKDEETREDAWSRPVYLVTNTG